MTDHRPPPPGTARRLPPPPPGTENRRKYPRYELLAQVELEREGAEVSLLDVGNISMGGLFVLGDPEAGLAAGDPVDVFIDLDGDIELRAPAEVVRVTEAGIAMQWRSNDADDALARLLEHIQAMADD